MTHYYPSQDAITALVKELSGITNAGVKWSNAPASFDALAGLTNLAAPVATPDVTYSGAVSIDLSIPSFSSPFWDDTGRVVDGTNKQVVTESGIRHYTLAIRISSDQVNSQDVAERIRAGFRRRSTTAKLRVFRSALRDVLETRVVEIKWDTRVVKVAIVEVLLTYAFEAIDPNGGEANGDWIESITTANPLHGGEG